MSEAVSKLRAWRQTEGLNLDEACALFASKGYPLSIAKLSRMERDQEIPIDDLPVVQEVTGIPAKELAPALAKIFEKTAAQ